jgi:hypothetical protein
LPGYPKQRRDNANDKSGGKTCRHLRRIGQHRAGVGRVMSDHQHESDPKQENRDHAIERL